MVFARASFELSPVMQGHAPVLLDEVVQLLARAGGSHFLDCTFGGGGHSQALLRHIPGSKVTALDRDPWAAARAEPLREQFPGRFSFIDANFRDLHGIGLEKVDGILFDLGVSSFQLDEAGRGFSFRKEAPLDLRMDPRTGTSAAHWLETVPADQLARALREEGEEPNWRRLSRAILQARGTGRLATTSGLSSLIEEHTPAALRRKRHLHPATLTFQALRMVVNDELQNLREALPGAFSLLAPQGVLAVISFHSLEDRITKRYFRTVCGQPVDRQDHRASQDRRAEGVLLTRKAIFPGTDEVALNPRARSARLRALQKL